MRIVVIADVHGNRLALEAVMADARSLSFDALVNLGDCLAGPFDPAGAADIQMAETAITIAGNHERAILDGSPDRLDAVARAALAPAHLDWLAALPATARWDRIFACHGSPVGGDCDSLLDRIADGSSVLATADEVRAKLAGIGDAKVVLCAHSHVPRAADVDGVLVFNPGSVGLPAFRITGPTPVVMEAGTPHARYGVLTKRSAGWSFEHRAVAYDWEAAGAQAEERGFRAVAGFVRTGRG